MAPRALSTAPVWRARRLLVGLCLALPWLLFAWQLPFSRTRTIGNDYPRFAIETQQELFFSLRQGTWPTWVPGFAGGRTASALTLGQLYHPQAWLAAHLPGYWSGHALDWNTALRLVALGVCHLLLWRLLARLRVSSGLAWVLALVTVYQACALELFRYGASLESWTGHLLLVCALGEAALAPRPGRREGLLIAGASYWLVTSGHPQFAYYGFLGAAAFALLLPGLLRLQGVADLDAAARRRLWLHAALATLAGVLLASAYTVPFALEFLRTNAGRVTEGYAWAARAAEPAVSAWANLFDPLRPSPHSAFGGSTLVAIAALTPLALLGRERPPRVVLAAWSLALLAFLHMLGPATPVHGWVWRWMPLAQSLRIPGRTAMLLPVLLLIPLVWSVGRAGPGRRPAAGLAWASLALGGVTLLATAATPYTGYSPHAIRAIPAGVGPLLHVTGALTLLALTQLDGPRARAARAALAGSATLTTALVLAYGTWVQPWRPTPTWAELSAQKRERLAYRPLEGDRSYSRQVEAQLRQGLLDPRLAFVSGDAQVAPTSAAAFDQLRAGVRRLDQVVTVGGEALTPPPRFAAELELAEATFDRLVFDVTSSARAYLVTNLPFHGRWEAWADDGPRPVLAANGLATAIPLTPGAQRITIQHVSPAGRLGLALSALTALALVLAWGPSSRSRRLALAALTLALGGGLLALHQRSTHGGAPLGTRYRWRSPPRAPVPNLAYGKPVYTYAEFDQGLTRYPPSAAVDGDATPGTGFFALPAPEPWLVVDLGQSQPLGAVAVALWDPTPTRNRAPLRLSLSRDGQRWSQVRPLPPPVQGFPAVLIYPPRTEARYLRLVAADCELAVRELQAFPPR